MGRTLLILAAFAAAVVLLRPRGQRQVDGLRGWPWLAVGLTLQVLWVRAFSTHSTSPTPFTWLPSLALLLALRFVWLNRRYRGLWILAAGAGLNLLVMAWNGGLMPIAPSVLHALGGPHSAAGATLALSKDRLLADGAVHLAFLDDRLVWAIAGLHIACSLGDVLVALGCLATVGEELWCSAGAFWIHTQVQRGTWPTLPWRFALFRHPIEQTPSEDMTYR